LRHINSLQICFCCSNFNLFTLALHQRQTDSQVISADSTLTITYYFLIIAIICIAMPINDPVIIPLDQCDKGQSLRIVDLLAQPRFGAQDEQVTLRLKELGFLPGNRLTVIGFGLMGRDPLAVQVNGTKFALRRAEASKILVELVDI
jgi:ferrous iron transport protein A